MAKSKVKSNWTIAVEISAVLGVILAFLGTIIALLALKVSVDTQKDARNIAIESGSLDKPDIQLFLSSFNLSKNSINKIFLGSSISDKKNINLAQLNFILLNRGKKSAQNVEIIDEVPKFSRPSFEKLIKLDVVSPSQAKKGDLKHSVTEIGNFSYFYYGFSSVKPEEAMKFSSPFLVEETRFEQMVDTGKNGKFNIEVRYAVQHHISISFEDSPKVYYPIEVSVVNSQNNDELVNKVSNYLLEDVKKKRESLSFPSSWFQILESRGYVAFVNPNLINESEGIKLNELKFDEQAIGEITIINNPIPLLIIIYGLPSIVILFIIIFSIYYVKKRKASKLQKQEPTTETNSN